jgi:hypothetical protein
MTGKRQKFSELNQDSQTTGLRSLKQHSLPHSRDSWIALERFPVSYCLIALALFLTHSTALHAQRHGRADAIENYSGRIILFRLYGLLTTHDSPKADTDDIGDHSL